MVNIKLISKTLNCRGNLIPVGIWGIQLIRNSYLWSTAEGGTPIVIATMLQKEKKIGNSSFCIAIYRTILLIYLNTKVTLFVQLNNR
jgi:hypothetical protein